MREQQLKKILSDANKAYYNGKNSGIDDLVYDNLKQEYKKILISAGKDISKDEILSQDNIGATPSSLLQKVKHKIFMGSLDNSMTLDDFIAFDKRVGGGEYWCNPKIDGASVALYYKNGKLDKAVTRGDGNIGDDITENVQKFKNVPLKVDSGFTGTVRGEAILYKKEWRILDPKEEKNPRNLGSGIIQRLDGSNSNLMRILGFDIHIENKDLKTEKEKIFYMKGLGFEVSEGKLCKDADEVIAYHKELESNREKLPFWIDGLVVKIDDLNRQEQLGWSGRRPKSQTAFKFIEKMTKTTVEDIVWSVGHTGAQIPTAKLTPVKICGTTVQNVLLCNMDEIERLDLAIGDEVEVYKAGGIIPHLAQVTYRPKNRKPINEPKTCVICGGKTQRRQGVDEDTVGAITECTNDDCSAKVLGKIKNFISKVEILGLGDTIVEALVQQGVIKTIPDLYRLDEKTLSNIVAGNQVGDKRAKEIIKEIDKKRELTIDVFMGSLGIEHLGRRRVEIIRKNVLDKTGKALFNNLDDWLNGELLTYKDEAGVPGVGDTIQKSINKSKSMILDLSSLVKIVVPVVKVITGKLSGKVFCLTGAMSRKRSEIEKDIKDLGGLTADDISNKDVILVQADPTSVSSKSKKANKLGAKIISEDDLNKLIS